jgi:hypothetical protein
MSKYKIKFKHNESSLGKALNVTFDMEEVTKDMRESLKEDKLRTEILEDIINKHDPQTPEDLLGLGLILGGLNGTEMLSQSISKADLPPGLIREMFDSLLQKAFHVNLKDMKVNEKLFKETMGDKKHNF